MPDLTTTASEITAANITTHITPDGHVIQVRRHVDYWNLQRVEFRTDGLGGPRRRYAAEVKIERADREPGYVITDLFHCRIAAPALRSLDDALVAALEVLISMALRDWPAAL